MMKRRSTILVALGVVVVLLGLYSAAFLSVERVGNGVQRMTKVFGVTFEDSEERPNGLYWFFLPATHIRAWLQSPIIIEGKLCEVDSARDLIVINRTPNSPKKCSHSGDALIGLPDSKEGEVAAFAAGDMVKATCELRPIEGEILGYNTDLVKLEKIAGP